MTQSEIFQSALALITALSLLYNIRITSKAKKREQDEEARKTQLESQAADRRQNFEEMKASVAAAREDNAYLKQEALDARAEKAELEAENRAFVARLRVEYTDQIDKERHGCKQAVDNFARRFLSQVEPIVPPEKREELKATLYTLHTELTRNHFGQQSFDDRETFNEPPSARKDNRD